MYSAVYKKYVLYSMLLVWIHQAFSKFSGKQSNFHYSVQRFQTYLSLRRFAPFAICMLQINCLLQRCVHLFAQPISKCYLYLWNTRMLSPTAGMQKPMLMLCCGKQDKFWKFAFIVLAMCTNVVSTSFAKKHKPVWSCPQWMLCEQAACIQRMLPCCNCAVTN